MVFKMKGHSLPGIKQRAAEPGDSPITNEFGIGKGTSPYKQGNLKKGLKFAAGLGTAILTGGLDAAYGTGKVIKPNPFASDKDDEEAQANSPEENIEELTNGTDETNEEADTSDTSDTSNQMPNAEWEEGENRAKDMGYNMDDLLKNQKNYTKMSNEWKKNQNLINEALGNDKRYKVD